MTRSAMDPLEFDLISVTKGDVDYLIRIRKISTIW